MLAYAVLEFIIKIYALGSLNFPVRITEIVISKNNLVFHLLK